MQTLYLNKDMIAHLKWNLYMVNMILCAVSLVLCFAYSLAMPLLMGFWDRKTCFSCDMESEDEEEAKRRADQIYLERYKSIFWYI